MLIRHGLVEGQYNFKADFLTHNRKLIQEIEAEAAKSRRTDLLVEDQLQFDFYDARITSMSTMEPGCGDGSARHSRKTRRTLHISREDLIAETADETFSSKFPDSMRVGAMDLPLGYHFIPGEDNDGITITVPQIALNQLDAGSLGWLVPGLLEQKVVALIRSLPKSIRPDSSRLRTSPGALSVRSASAKATSCRPSPRRSGGCVTSR